MYVRRQRERERERFIMVYKVGEGLRGSLNRPRGSHVDKKSLSPS